MKNEDEVLEMLLAGIPAEGIAEELSVGINAIHRLRRAHGIKIRRNKLSAQNKDDIATSYTNGTTVTDISATYNNLNFNALYKILKEKGVPLRKDAQGDELMLRLLRAAEMYEDGISLAEILDVTKVRQPRLHSYLKAVGVPLRRPGHYLKKVDESKAPVTWEPDTVIED